MFLLLLRRLLELVLFSVVPGCLALIIIYQDSLQRSAWFYPVLLIVSIVCALIFFLANMLMMRRMVRDISSKEKYHFVQWVAFGIYTVLIALVCFLQKDIPIWKDLRAACFFHSRVFEVITDPIVIDAERPELALITPTQSMIISTVLYGILTAVSYKWFNYLYDKEVATQFEQNEAERIATMEVRKVYQHRQEKIEKAIRKGHRVPHGDFFDDLDFSSRKRFGSRTAMNSSEKLKYRLKSAIFEAGSYSFYQRYIMKKENGEDAAAFARHYFKNKLSINFSLKQTRKMR